MQSKCHCLHHRKACGSGRRMFVAAIITASKYLEDRSLPNTRWARITGLCVQEINSNERIFLELLNYRLYMTPSLFTWWMMLLFGSIDGDTISLSNQEPRHVAKEPSRPKAHTRFSPYQNARVRTVV
ncbi:hypothetical protein K493DRAFT_284890 [Basidiobolus meristosporus CBS 931.73]|uniref:Cyclin N-terminal domain-containing protein n=1 Tax=Basidiobolus meristosporus CBS 931.73 TaxID=1314790 RepID=A0A1Y1Y5F3_9FUNG|nr:hypothetical protein K493DRAFT_284890 [Basidiobolus meristosporus CBS 931.73]|eukprot:ORX93237.1 hypothetical protein K493DRAFT_284890 [Basidiobolus meristosporus CBS 931.73]